LADFRNWGRLIVDMIYIDENDIPNLLWKNTRVELREGLTRQFGTKFTNCKIFARDALKAEFGAILF